MKKRKFTDEYTGKLPRPEKKETKTTWGGSSSYRMKFYAILESNTYYKNDDDNYANFEGFCDYTPEFGTLNELMEYMDKNNIKIGSMLTRDVPINDGYHKAYKRTVSVPITDISYRFKYEMTLNSSVLLGTTSEENPDVFEHAYDGDFDKLEIEGYNHIIQQLYSISKSKNAFNKNPDHQAVSFTFDLNEMKTVMDILKIKDPDIQESDNVIGYLEAKKETVGDKFKARYEKMMETVKKSVIISSLVKIFKKKE